MKKKLLIGILVLLGIAMSVFNPLLIGLLAAGIWIYLFSMVRKQKSNVLNDQMDPEMSERHLKRLKTLLIVGGFSFLVFITGAVMHNILHGVSEIEESVYFFIALAGLVVFVAATAGGLVIFLKERQKS